MLRVTVQRGEAKMPSWLFAGRQIIVIVLITGLYGGMRPDVVK